MEIPDLGTKSHIFLSEEREQFHCKWKSSIQD